jgi:GH24 family phage-related lysozyme (muramidase)
MHAILKRGMPGTPSTVADIKFLQKALGLRVDGDFGALTESAVKDLQGRNDLPADGVVGPHTWEIIDILALEPEEIRGFHGDLKWIHNWEGHAGHPYVPTRDAKVIGASGITLDPGVDLGHVDPAVLRRHYLRILGEPPMKLLETLVGLRGANALKAFELNKTALMSMRISRDQASAVFPLVAAPYWETVSTLYRPLKLVSTPYAVHTAMLSLAYNRGPGNKALRSLLEPMSACDWPRMADIIAAMAASTSDPGLKRRRLAEAKIVRDSL